MFFVNVSTKALDLRESPNQSSEVLDILHVGGVVEASHKFLHEGNVWIKVVSNSVPCYLHDESILTDNINGDAGTLLQIPGPSQSLGVASCSNYWPSQLRGASPWSCLYMVTETIQIYAEPSLVSANLRQLNAYRIIEISQHKYDSVTKTMWGKVVNGDCEEIEVGEKQETEMGRWAILSEATFRSSASSSQQDCSLKLKVLDIPLGEPWCFRNVYHHGEVPIRSEPKTKSSIVEILPAFISVQARESMLTPSGELWVHISPQFKPFKEGWIVVMASHDGSTILDPFSLDRYCTSSDVNHPRYKQFHVENLQLVSKEAREEDKVRNIAHQWLIEAYDNDGSDVLFFRNILRKAALPFREDPSLSSPVVSRLPLGGCLKSAGERLLTKEGQVWARCILQLGNHDVGNKAVESDTEAVWAVERNAKDGTTILEKIRGTFQANDEKNNIKALQMNFKKRLRSNKESPIDNKHTNSHHIYGIVYIVRHNGDLPVLSQPGYGEPGCKELGSLSNGSIFIAKERRLNVSRSPPSMWLQLKETNEDTLMKYQRYLSSLSGSSHTLLPSMSAAMQSGQAAMQSGLNLKIQNPFTMSTSTSTRARSGSKEGSKPEERSSAPHAPPDSLSCMFESMKYGGGWVPESLGGISSSVSELTHVIPFHLDEDSQFLEDNENMVTLLNDQISETDEGTSDHSHFKLDMNDEDIDEDDMVVYVDSPDSQHQKMDHMASTFVPKELSILPPAMQSTDNDLDWLDLPPSESTTKRVTKIDTIKEMKKMRMKMEEEARREQALLKAEEDRKAEELLKEKKLKDLRRKEELQRLKDEEAARIQRLKEEEEEKKRLEGEAELRDLLDALDSFTEEDTKRAQDRRMKDADNWTSAKEGTSDYTIRTPPPLVSPRGNYYLGALTVKLRRPPKPPGSVRQPALSANSSYTFFDDSDEELELEDDGIRLYYTTDGSDPDPRFSLSDPLEIDIGPGVTHIKVIACGRDMKPSKVVHARYVVYGDGYGKCCLVDLAIRCHHCVFKSGFVQKVRSKLFWPRRRNTRRSSYAPLSGQTNGGTMVPQDDFSMVDENDEFNTINEHQPKKKKSSMMSYRFGFKRRNTPKRVVIGGGGLDDRYKQAHRRPSGWSTFLDAIGMSTPRETSSRRGYANVDFEGEF